MQYILQLSILFRKFPAGFERASDPRIRMLVTHHKIKVRNTEMKIPPSPHGQDKTAENESLQYPDFESDLDFFERARLVPRETEYQEPNRNIIQAIDREMKMRRLGVSMW
jgi:hypothetical protein